MYIVDFEAVGHSFTLQVFVSIIIVLCGFFFINYIMNSQLLL